MLERKHVEAIEAAWENMVGTAVVRAAINDALAACDESPTAAERAVGRIKVKCDELHLNIDACDLSMAIEAIIEEEEARDAVSK